MSKKRSAIGLAVTAACLLALAAGNAKADTLLPLIDQPVESDVFEPLSFTAAGNSTTIAFGGYQTQSEVTASYIDFFLNGTSIDLLGSSWTHVAPVSGSGGGAYDNGTVLVFSGTNDSDYDTYSQTIAVTPGDSYTLQFFYENDSTATNGLVVTATGVAPVPEPATGALMLLGLLGLAVAIRARPVRPVRP